MGKKRKHSETEVVAPPKKDTIAAERPKRTLLGWKDKNEEVNKESDSTVFRNKEKVLVTCSRRINYRLKSLFLSISL
jgi:ribosome biogenesis protein BRX1